MKLLYRHEIRLTGRFIEGRITHYLKFSLKITTNKLHHHFRKKVTYLEKEISELCFEYNLD